MKAVKVAPVQYRPMTLFVFALSLSLASAPTRMQAAPPVAAPGFEAAAGTIVDARWNSGVPLGGIGVGKLELLTDGSFGAFTFNHNWDRPYPWAKGAFAAIRTQVGTAPPTVKLLRLNSAGEYRGVGNIAHTRMQGWFPRAEIDFIDPQLPLSLHLDAFSPLIPHDVKESALPVACLTYTLMNPTARTIRTSLLLAWPNLLGWGGRVGTAYEDYIGNRQTQVEEGRCFGLRYAATQDYTDARKNTIGDYFVGVRVEPGLTISTDEAWDAGADRPAFWSQFQKHGTVSSAAGHRTYPARSAYPAQAPTLRRGRFAPTVLRTEHACSAQAPSLRPPLLTDEMRIASRGRSAAGPPAGYVLYPAAPNTPAATVIPAGAVSVGMLLKPGQSRTIRFYVAWDLPHHLMSQQRTTYGQETVVSHEEVGAMIDGDPNSRWSTKRPMQAGDNLVIDLGAEQPLDRLVLDAAASPSDYPRGMAVETSSNGRNWRQVVLLERGSLQAKIQAGGVLETSLKGVRGRLLRLTNLNADSYNWWSIHELKIYAEGRAAPLPLTKEAITANLIRATVETFTEDVGCYYRRWFSSAAEVAAYTDRNAERLLSETRAWQEPVRRSSLPFWLKLKLINAAFPLYSNTILTGNGRFAVLESPVDMGGATGTMDQRMAAHAFLTAFFPELDRAELELFAACQQPDGRITHLDGNIHEVIGRPDVGYGVTDWPDLSCSWVMQVAKLYRWTGDERLLSRMRPHLSRAMAWLETIDYDHIFIPEGGSTYDYEPAPPGAFIYSASCYLGALRAAIALAEERGERSTAEAYRARLDGARKSVLTLLWNGTFFRKWSAPSVHKTNENSFIACLAGDWLARLTGLPRTLPRDIVHRAVAQTILRHQKRFLPVPPMEVTPDGKSATAVCFLLQHEPYLGCEAIYENYVDDGLETLRRVYLCAWERNHSPWNESLIYSAPTGDQGGLVDYMTAPTTWHVLNALSGASLDLPRGALFLSPRLASGQSALHIPIFFPRFWAWLDYQPALRQLTLRIDRVFPAVSPLAPDLYVRPGGRGSAGPPERIVLVSVQSDVDSPALPLPQPFIVRPGARLDLSPLLDRMALPQQSETLGNHP